MVKNERIIKDIDPVHGVTPNQLYEHCSAIVRTIPSSMYLDEHQQNDAVSNAVLKIKKKMDEGKLDKYNYYNFRGYLFTVLTNSVYLENKKKLYRRNEPTLKVIPMEDYNIDDQFEYQPEKTEFEYQKDIVDYLVKKLPVEKQELYTYMCKSEHKSIQAALRDYQGEFTKYWSLIDSIKLLYEKELKNQNNKKVNLEEYIQTSEIFRIYRVGWKKLKQLIAEKNINVVSIPFNGSSKIMYIHKSDVDKLNLKNREINMERKLYYSQTDIAHKYHISKRRIKELIKEHNIPVTNNTIDFHTYRMNVIYVKKEDFDAIGLPLPS